MYTDPHGQAMRGTLQDSSEKMRASKAHCKPRRVQWLNDVRFGNARLTTCQRFHSQSARPGKRTICNESAKRGDKSISKRTSKVPASGVPLRESRDGHAPKAGASAADVLGILVLTKWVEIGNCTTARGRGQCVAEDNQPLYAQRTRTLS